MDLSGFLTGNIIGPAPNPIFHLCSVADWLDNSNSVAHLGRPDHQPPGGILASN